MNTITKRLLSMLVVVAMVLSMSPVITLPAAAATDVKAAVDAWEAENAATFDNATGEIAGTCPICGGASVTWEPLNSQKYGPTSGDHHYYLAEELDLPSVKNLFNGYTGQTVCFYMNKNITTSGNIKVYGTINIFGDGIYTYNGGNDLGMFDIIYNTIALNIYSGTFTNTAVGNSEIPKSQSMFAIDSSKPISIYGGTFNTGNISLFKPDTAGSATLNIYGGTINGGDAPVIDHTIKSGTVNIAGGVINGGKLTASDGGAIIRMTQNATITISGGVLRNGQTKHYGGNIDMINGTITMTGGEIYGGTIYAGGWAGGNVYLKGGTFNLQGGKIYNGTSDLRGGNICVDVGTLTITGGEIYGGTTAGSNRPGGNICLGYNASDVATATMTGGKIYNGTASGKGGNVYVGTNSTFAMSGDAEMYGGTASGSYPEIMVEGGVMTMAGNAKITAKENSQAVGIEYKTSGDGASLTMSDNASIVSANGGFALRLYNLVNDKLIFADGWSGDCYLYIVETGYSVGGTLPAAVSYSGAFNGNLFFTSNDDDISNNPVKVVDGALTIQEPAPEESEMDLYKDIADTKERVDAWVANNSGDAFASGYCPVCSKEVTWIALSGEQSNYNFMRCGRGDYENMTEVHFYLSGDVNYTGTAADHVMINDGNYNTCLYLNNKTITTREGFDVYGTFNIIGGESGMIVRPADATGTGYMFFDRSGSTVVNIYGGTYQENTTKDMIYGNYPTASYTLYGGTYEAKATVFNGWFDSELTTYDANISAGGVAITTRGSTIVMNGGSVTYTGEEALNTSGGVIYLRAASERKAASLTLNNVTISGGNVIGGGGNIYVAAGNTVTMNGGEIKDGTASDAGNVSIQKESTFIMTGNAVISGGTATNKNANTSHNITLNGGTLIMEDNAKVIDKYNEIGGAIFAWNNGTPGVVKLYDNASVETTAEGGATNLIRIYVSANADNMLEIGAGWNGTAYFYYADKLGCEATLSNKSAKCEAAGYTGTLYHSGVKVYAVDGALVTAAALKLVTAEGEEWFQTIEEALAAYKAAEGAKYLRAVANASIEIDGDIYLNVNHVVEISGAGTVYLMSSNNDDYEGYGYIKPTGDVQVAPEAVNPINGYRYVAIQDEYNAEGGFYSAHRIEIKLYAVTLRASRAGMYYKAAYTCDDKLASRISAYGVMLSAECTPAAKTVDELQAGAFSALSDFAEKMAEAEDHTVAGTSCALWGIMKATYSGAENLGRAQNKIYANAYIYVDVDGTSDESDDVILLGDEANAGTQNGVAYSLVDMLKEIDENWNEYTEAQQNMVEDFVAEWAGLEGDKAVDWSSCNFTNF